MRVRYFRALVVCVVLVSIVSIRPYADTTVQALPFSQNWSNIGLIAADDNWAGVPGIVGYRGDSMVSVTGVDPQTVLIDAGSGGPVVDVNANQTNPNTFTTGGVAEFQITNPVVALQGSGTARAPNIVITVSTTGFSNINVSYTLRDIDGSADNAVQPVALQYRVGTSGNYTNVPAGFVTDASSGPNLATLVTAVNVTLPAAASNQPVVQIRVITTDAVGSDEWIGIDDISITGTGGGDVAPAVTSTTPANGATNVPVNSNITINFSEPVNATTSSFSLQCPSGSAKTFTFSPSTPAASFVLDPTSDLPFNTVCTVTAIANQITDTDGIPDNMAADFTFSFTTVQADAAPAVTTTTPANSAVNVAVDSNIVINFSESVSASAGAFSVQCPAGSPQAFTQTDSPATSFTLDPSSPLPSNTTCTVTIASAQISDTDTDDPPDQMAADVTFSFSTPPAGAGKVIINEIDADTPGNPDQAEFVELYDGGIGNTPLDGLVVVLYDGGLTPFNGRQSYAAFDLDGYTTDANGYFVLGNPGVPGAGLVFDPGPFGLLQNGPDAVALYVGSAADFPNGTNATTTNLLDAIVYGTDDPKPSNLLLLIDAGQLIVNENANGAGTLESSQRCPNGMGGIRTSSAYQQATPTPGAVNTCPPQALPSDIVISQIYGGGGNAGAPYTNDYVELFNRGAGTVDLTGWSIQYASAAGSGWDFNLQPLGGSIGAGEYYLIALASGATGAPLPAANITGLINMSGTTGKVALADTYDPLSGNCPLANPHVRDFVGYGTAADCGEGATTTLAPSNTTAIFRLGAGAVDTNVNRNDFVTGGASPRRTAAIVEIGPFVLNTDPRRNDLNAPRDATIQLTFTEPVDVFDPWFDITCAVTGQHNDATQAGSGRDHYITPNVNFQAGEQCTVTIFKNQVHDQDLDDAGPNTDTLTANFAWSFTVATGTAPPFPPSIHLTMGNPSGAVASIGEPNNYLMEKPEFTLSYNRDLGRPNWVSWHLSNEWTGTLERVDTFRPDPQVPPDWYRVQSFDFSGSGFDRGHMTPNADRDKETSIPINQATFLMSNMVAQAPDNNQGPWAAFEGFLRTLTDDGSQEIFIVAGPAGVGGVGSNVPAVTTMTLANGHVVVPASTWKVALVLPKDTSDPISRVSCATRTIAVIMPNTQGIRNNAWQNYLTTVDAVETLTGYDLFSTLPPSVQYCVEAGTDGNNPPPDVNAPTVSCAPADGAWHADNVTLACTASDGASGLANPADASFSLVTSVPAGVEDANASTDSRTVCDVAGNCATVGPIAGNMIDRRAPVIAVTAPAAGAVYQLNQVVGAAYGCSDGGSGPGTCTGTVANLGAIDTASLGSKSFIVNATDAVGNPSSTTVTYEVRRTLTVVGPAKVWIGLKNSDDVGLRLDLRADVFVNGTVAATGMLDNVAAGSSGFTGALLPSIAMSLSDGAVDIPTGATLALELSARRTCSGGGHNSGTAREWFNGQSIDSGASRDAGSRIRFTIAGTTADYFLRSPFSLATTAGAARMSVDAAVNSTAACPARPFVLFRTWSLIVP